MTTGTLFVVATPIGNREDITLRALSILKSSDIIACEDTRHFQKLAEMYEIRTPKTSFHQNTHPEKILALLREGKNVALVSDAGTPGISDPGTVLIAHTSRENIRVEPIGGMSAFLVALSASGLPTNHFEFFGFLPQKKGRQTFYKNLQNISHTSIFYESSHRILKCLTEMTEHLPERYIVIGKEISKIHERFFRGTPSEIQKIFEEDQKLSKGEFVVLIGGTGFFPREKEERRV